MHFHKPATVWLLALATGQFISGRAIGAEATHWGQPVSGMRAGVAIAAGKSGLELIVDFQNVGSRAFSLRIASGAAMGSGYDFSTWAVSPEGTSVELYFRPGVSVGGILKVGLPYFLVEQIPPGGPTRLRNP
jgi:hypothetical protein